MSSQCNEFGATEKVIASAWATAIAWALFFIFAMVHASFMNAKVRNCCNYWGVFGWSFLFAILYAVAVCLAMVPWGKAKYVCTEKSSD